MYMVTPSSTFDKFLPIIAYYPCYIFYKVVSPVIMKHSITKFHRKNDVDIYLCVGISHCCVFFMVVLPINR